MAKVELKQPIVDQIAEEIKDAQSVVLVDHRGLTVAQDTELRKQLREAGVVYKVYKNTMMKRAFEGTDFAALDGCLEGPSAIAISKDDATAPARILYKFAQDAPALELKGGVVEQHMMLQESLNLLRSLQETNSFPSCLEACSHLLQTLLVLSIRSQSRVEKPLLQRKQQPRRQQRHLQSNLHGKLHWRQAAG